eukprot:363013-Chlamydomonas_euryale.AAC.2
MGTIIAWPYHKCGLVCAERCVAPEAEHTHLVRGCQLCNCLANVAKPDNAQCLATQLLHVIRRPFPSSLRPVCVSTQQGDHVAPLSNACEAYPAREAGSKSGGGSRLHIP